MTQSEVRIKLGQYLAQSGQAPKAIALLKDTAGNDPDALIALGNAYTVAGRFGEASATFRRILAADPNNALALQDLGIVQLQAKDLPGAEASLRRAVQLDPSLAGAYTALGVAVRHHRPQGRRDRRLAARRRARRSERRGQPARYSLTASPLERTTVCVRTKATKTTNH